MKRIETSITIKSTPEQVWKTLMDFDDYPTWNPFAISIKGNEHVGSALEVTFSLDGKPMLLKPNVTKNAKNRHFSWLGHLFVKGLFDGHHHFVINPLGNEEIQFKHYEEFSGVLTGPLLKMIGAKTKAGFEAMNIALKKRIENSGVFLNENRKAS